MARPLRIEFPGAVYHVSNFALTGKRLFPAPKYFETFLEGLAETCSRLNVEVLAYCLLHDQYHLLVKTPEANLSRFMRQVDGLYTQNYQRLKSTNGSLFKGRYKAVLVQADKYLLPLSRYLHRLVKVADVLHYPWSSCRFYASSAKLPAWLHPEDGLKQLRVSVPKRANAYKKYVLESVDAGMTHFYGKKNLGSIMGDSAFVKTARKHRSVTTVRGMSRGIHANWRPSCSQITTAVARLFKVSESSIYKAARGPRSKNVPRWVAMYLCQELSAVTLQSVARLFGLKRYGTVSTTVGKLKQELAADRALLNATDKLTRQLSRKK